MPPQTTYTTKPGDSAQTLAKTYNTTPDAIKATNPTGQFQGGGQDFWGPNVTLKIPGQTPVAPPTSQLITTSTKSRTNFAQNSATLDNAYAKLSGVPTTDNPNPSPGGNGSGDNTSSTTTILGDTTDPIISGLNTLQTNSDAATKALLASTQALYQNKINAVNKQYDNYKRGLQGLGIEHNDAQATPDLLAGHIQQAANEQMDKINALTAEESKALIDAKSAKDSNDFKTLQAKMDYVKQVQTQKADAIKNMYDSIANSDKAAGYEAHDIYDTMQTLGPEDQKAFIAAVATKYKIPLTSLVTALNDEKQSRADKALTTANKASILANRGGGGTSGGLSKSQIALGEQKLNDSRGDDGWVDPAVYQAAFDDWKGTTKAFLLAYPPKDYVNPENTTLPKYLQPAKSKSASASGVSLNDIQ